MIGDGVVRPRAVISCCVAGCLVLCTAPASAQSSPTVSQSSQRPLVILVRPPSDRADLAEAPTRIRAELEAAGFAVETVDGDPSLEPREQLRQIERQSTRDPAPVATIVLADAAAGMAADIWVADRRGDKTTVRRIDIAATAQAPSILAVRTVELLRASLLETAPASAPAPTTEPSRPSETATEEAQLRQTRDGSEWLLDLGASGLFGFDRLGPSFGPQLRLAYDLGGVSLALGLAAPWFGPWEHTAQGDARLQPTLLRARTAFELAGSDSMSLHATLAAGAALVQAQADARAPATGHETLHASAVTSLGIEGEWHASRQLSVFVEPELLGFFPALSLRVAGQEVGRLGHPAAALNVGLRGRL